MAAPYATGLEALSDADLRALQTGDITKVSDAGLAAIQLAGAKATPVNAQPEPPPKGILENLGAGVMGAARGAGQALEVPGRVGNWMGEAMTDMVARSPAGPKVAPFVGAATATIPEAISDFGGFALKPGAQAVRKSAEWLMKVAMNPSLKDLETADKVPRALATMLDKGSSPFLLPGTNVTPGGLDFLLGTGKGAVGDAQAAIGASSARIPPQTVAAGLDRLPHPVPGNMNADLAEVDKVRNEFWAHPSVTGPQAEYQALADQLQGRTAAKVSALQDAGRYRTMAAQQENLAHGGGIRGTPTPLNEPYTNVGAADARLSPSAYPNMEYPRVPGRYTDNVQRVPEANSAFEDTMAVYRQRRAEEEAARATLERASPDMTAQGAQGLKQDLYRDIGDRAYGEIGSATTGAQKALAHELRMELEKAVPGVIGPNATASEMFNAANVMKRRALTAGNRSPVSIAPFAHDVGGALAFLTGRSPLAQSLAARLLNQTQRVPGSFAGTALGMQLGIPNEQDKVRQAALAEQLRSQ